MNVIAQEYEKCDFGDGRIGKRVRSILMTLFVAGNARIYRAFGRHPAKAVYRLLGNKKFKRETMMKTTQDITRAAIENVADTTILVAQDTTEIDYTGLAATTGLGTHGSRKESRGLLVHSAIALREDGTPIGLMSQKIWTRPIEDFGKGHTENKHKPIAEKESYKWVETMQTVAKESFVGKRIVNICDREGDIYELFAEAESTESLYLCRCFKNRQIAQGEQGQKAFEYVGGLPAAGTLLIHVPKNSTLNTPSREAVLTVHFGEVSILKPKSSNISKEAPESITATIVIAKEEGDTKGSNPISWYLITNLEVIDSHQALKTIEYYTHRWKVERFHYALKTGYCDIENLKSSTADRLEKLICLYSIVAMQLLVLTYAARNTPDEPCTAWLEKDEWKILWRIAKKTKTAPSNAPTIHQAVTLIANLGGYVSRKSAPDPGILVIWRGLSRFRDAIEFSAWLR